MKSRNKKKKQIATLVTYDGSAADGDICGVLPHAALPYVVSPASSALLRLDGPGNVGQHRNLVRWMLSEAGVIRSLRWRYGVGALHSSCEDL